MSRPNIHATAIVVGDRGILIRGPSGSGKTTLALTLVQNALQAGRHAALISDDQLFVEAHAGRLLVYTPESIAGLAEAYGFAPQPVEARPNAQIDLVVELTEKAAPRFQEIGKREISGIEVAALTLPARHTLQSQVVLAAWLGLRPFLP